MHNTKSTQETRTVTHIVVGSSEWQPTAAELSQVAVAFMQAEGDPLGGCIATRSDISMKQYEVLTTPKTVRLEQDIVSCAVAYAENIEQPDAAWLLSNLLMAVQQYVEAGGNATTQISLSHTCV